jgi:hypothetical protein
LVAESGGLEERASRVQAGDDESIDSLATNYQSLLGRCLALLDDDLADRFRSEYSGGIFPRKSRTS